MPGFFVPNVFHDWVGHHRISDRLPAGLNVVETVRRDVNAALTPMGSTYLHLLLANAPHPSSGVVMDVARFLINDCRADVNRANAYGRTPLTLLVADAPGLWSSHPWYSPHGNPANGLELLQLMLDRGGNPDVLYMPAMPAMARCERWRLVHECAYGPGRACLPDAMRRLLATRWDAQLPDSEGRIAAGVCGTCDPAASSVEERTPHLAETRGEREAERAVYGR